MSAGCIYGATVGETDPARVRALMEVKVLDLQRAQNSVLNAMFDCIGAEKMQAQVMEKAIEANRTEGVHDGAVGKVI